MKNMTKKRVISGVLTVALCALMCSTVLATDLLPNGGNVTFTPPGGKHGARMENMVGQVLGIVRIISFAVVIGMLFYLGIKYMTSAANEKADVKNASTRYLIGAILVYATVAIFDALWKTFADGWGSGSGR